MTENILGWTAAAVVVGGVIKYARDFRKIKQPNEEIPEPFSDADIKASRERVLTAMKEAGVPTSDGPR